MSGDVRESCLQTALLFDSIILTTYCACWMIRVHKMCTAEVSEIDSVSNFTWLSSKWGRVWSSQDDLLQQFATTVTFISIASPARGVVSPSGGTFRPMFTPYTRCELVFDVIHCRPTSFRCSEYWSSVDRSRIQIAVVRSLNISNEKKTNKVNQYTRVPSFLGKIRTHL